MTTEQPIDTAAVERHRQRADAMGDSMRRYLIGVNAGGIGVLATLVDKFEMQQIIWTLGLFTAGLALTGFSIGLQKAKAISLRKAAENGRDEPSFEACLQRNETYDSASFALFIVGALMFFACAG